MRSRRLAEHDWLVTASCALGLVATLYVLVQFGVPLEILLAALFLACLAVCGWAALVVSRARRKTEAAIRTLVEARRDPL